MSSIITFFIASSFAVTAATPLAPIRTDQGLSNEKLRETFVGFGYEVTDHKASDGRPIYEVVWKTDDDWTFALDASMSASKATVWLVLRLKKIEDPKKIPVEALLKLMAENDAIAPMSYSFDEKTPQFFLNQALDARDFSAASLRKALDAMTASARRTANYWNPDRWQK